jgi:hypothetical protein
MAAPVSLNRIAEEVVGEKKRPKCASPVWREGLPETLAFCIWITFGYVLQRASFEFGSV